MNRSSSWARFSVVAAILFFNMPCFAVSKEIIQLQAEVQNLQDQVGRMQQSFDERMGVMKNLIEQTTDTINKMNAGVTELNKALQQQNSETAGKVDQVSTQVQALHDSLDEMKVRVTRLGKQLDEMSAARENIASPARENGPASAPAAGSAPPPEVLYNNALGDYNTANYALANQEFAEFLKAYPDNDRAGNAQFYLADIEYKQGNFQQAVRDYDRVLEQYPGGTKSAAAQLKKGFVLLELGEREPGMQELRSLIARYPKSPEAVQARERLRRLGAAPRPAPRHRPR